MIWATRQVNPAVARTGLAMTIRLIVAAVAVSGGLAGPSIAAEPLVTGVAIYDIGLHRSRRAA
jgi:hypothetical protein